MKSYYYYPLIVSGAVAMLLTARSAQAATDDEKQFSQNIDRIQQEILASVEEPVENFAPIAIDPDTESAFSKEIDKVPGTFKSEFDFDRILTERSHKTEFESKEFESVLSERSQQWLAQTTNVPNAAPMVPNPQVTIQESGAANQAQQGVPVNSPQTPTGQQPQITIQESGNPNQTQGVPANSSQTPMVQQPQITIQESGSSNQPQGVPANSSQTPMVQQPQITIQDSNSANNPNNPNTDVLQTNTPVAPVLPRAVAPPVGDMAISNIDPSADLIDLGTDVLVPRLVLRQAPAREVLAVLARYAGLNLVFTDTQPTQQGQQEQAAPQAAEPTVSLDLENESVQEVFNSVLLVSGLRANRRGRTIFVGSNLPNEARNLISRTIRLNQSGVINAGTVLAAQGANFQRVITPVEEIVDPVTQRVVRRVERPAEIQPIKQGTEEGGSGSPLLLSGLTVTADDRLNAVTLTGDPRQVEIATSMLTQLDARRRQVAVNVKVVDINLSNTENFNSSFSFGINDTFFIQDQGAASLRFGSSAPPTSAEFNSATGRIANPPVIPNPLSGADTFLDFNNSVAIPGTVPGSVVIDNGNFSVGRETGTGLFPQRIPAVSQNPFQTGITDFTRATDDVTTITTTVDPTTGLPTTTTTFSRGTPGTATAAIASLFQYPKKFLAQLNAQITSGNAKILTDPTLMVQEGQEATVRLVERVLTSVETEVDPLSGVRTTTPVFEDAGLTLTVNIERIDDNGFISLSVSPRVAAPGNAVQFDSGEGSENTLTPLNLRELSSGLIRLRDGQTLILSGIIQETDRTIVSKVPILGDIPLLGALFRSTDNVSERAEVIILLTPEIIDDNHRSQFGYNYNPTPAASQMLNQRGFEVQTNPTQAPPTEEEQEEQEQ